MNTPFFFLGFASCLLSFSSSIWIDYGDNGNENANGIDASNQQCVDEFRQAALQAHNEFRSYHGSSKLIELNNLDGGAQKYAEYLAANNLFQHSQTTNLGENLWMSSGMANTCADFGRECAENWYNELVQYDFGNPGFSQNTGHFTQLVWRSSKKVGFGLGTKGGSNYCVARYYPPGNIIGRFSDNVQINKNMK